MASSKRVQVGLDAHVVGRHGTGNETYVVSLARALSGHPDIQPVLLLDRGARWSTAPGHEVHRLRVRSRVTRLAIELPLAAQSTRADLLLVQYVAPPFADVVGRRGDP